MVHCCHQQRCTSFRFFSSKVLHPWHWKAFCTFQIVDSESSLRPPLQWPATVFHLLMWPAEQHKAWREPCGFAAPLRPMALQVLVLPKLKYGTLCSNACATVARTQLSCPIYPSDWLYLSCLHFWSFLIPDGEAHVIINTNSKWFFVYCQWRVICFPVFVVSGSHCRCAFVCRLCVNFCSRYLRVKLCWSI